MKLEMRQKLAREPFAEKIRKVGQLIRLAKTFPPFLPKHSGSYFRQLTASQTTKAPAFGIIFANNLVGCMIPLLTWGVAGLAPVRVYQE